jgi:hypothetical protein
VLVSMAVCGGIGYAVAKKRASEDAETKRVYSNPEKWAQPKYATVKEMELVSFWTFPYLCLE